MRTHRAQILTTALIIAILMMGCAQHAHQIRSAQDSFSRGAELELARKFGFDVSGMENSLDESQRYYALALGTVNEAINDGKKDLKRDSLYGTALTIKALALWRLGDRQTAINTANDVVDIPATKDGTNKVWPRDKALCRSLKSLVKIDALARRAREFSAQNDADKKELTLASIILDSEETAVEIKNLANDSEIEGHSLQLYLAQAYCEVAFAAYDATAAAVFRLSDGTILNNRTADGQTKSYRQRYNELRNAALVHLKSVPKRHGLEGLKTSVDKMWTYYNALFPALDD